MNIETIETNWTNRPRSIAAALLSSGGSHALVDPGPASTLETVREELARRGVRFADLSAILLTHIHLDHSAATGALVRENPNLAVYVHEFGATHMADPAKLLASAGRLYGADMGPLYGEFLPVPKENLRPLQGGETIRLGSDSLRVQYTPGHASHHVTYFDEAGGVAFVGDVAGIRVQGDSFLLPPLPPPDIDIELWTKSLREVAAHRPQRLFLTHFAYADDPAEHIERYIARLNEWTGIAKKIFDSGMDEESAGRAFVEETTRDLTANLSEKDAAHYLFNGGLYLSWLGLARYLRKKSGKAATPSGSSR